MGIPQTKLHEGKEGNGFGYICLVLQLNLRYFPSEKKWYKKKLFDSEATSGSLDLRITETVAALIEGQLLFHGLEAWGPTIAPIMDVKVTAPIIEGYTIVSIAG
jgi:hypothetical protein